MGFRELPSDVGMPASQEPRKNLRPARKRLQPAGNKLQPARMQCQSAGKNSGSGSLMHILYPGFYAHDTRLLTSRILYPPWVLGLLGLLLSLPGSPWAPRAPWVWVLGLGLVPKYLPGLLSGVPRTWPLPWAPGFLVLVPWSLVLVPGGCKNQYSS